MPTMIPRVRACNHIYHQSSRLSVFVQRFTTRLTLTQPRISAPAFSTHTGSMASPQTPTTTPAIRIAGTGGPDVLTYTPDLPLAPLAAGQVLVRNAFAGINFIDTYIRTGLYPTEFPHTLGREASGTVAAVAEEGADGAWAVGDRVVFMHFGAGAYAAYSVVPADRLVRVPDALSLQDAAAALLQGLTAWTFVREAAEVQRGQWTLVHAAAGGVGSLLVQMLHAVGARVIGTAGSAAKCELAKQLGADWVVNYAEEDVVARVAEITAGHGVDAIFDGVGKDTFDRDLDMIARKGSLVSFGNASGTVPPVDILRLGKKNVKLSRPVVNNYVTTREELEKYSAELFDMITSGKVKVHTHKVYSLKDAAQSHIDLEGRKTTGKLLLKCNE